MQQVLVQGLQAIYVCSAIVSGCVSAGIGAGIASIGDPRAAVVCGTDGGGWGATFVALTHAMEHSSIHMYASFLHVTITVADKITHNVNKARIGNFGTRDIMLMFRGTRATKRATIRTSLMELCQMAETVRLRMGKYHVLKNNCQHFCNNVLKELRLTPAPTTVGPMTTEVKDIDDFNEVFTVIREDSEIFVKVLPAKVIA